MITGAMRVPAVRRALLFLGICAVVILVTRARIVSGSEASSDPAARRGKESPMAELVNVPGRSPGSARGGALPSPAPAEHAFVLHDSLFGRSGQLRVRLVSRDLARQLPEFRATFGEPSLRHPAVLGLSTAEDPEAFSFITMLPWYEKRGGFVGGYHVGWWPAERRLMSGKYENPTGFVEVTPENQATRLSTHFRLGDFVTRDQRAVWPKYVVLREALVDKLELVLDHLRARGVPARRPVVLSGFRTPQYNERIAGEGAAWASRHQYGDAADLIIDDDGDGRMDDLNRDGRVDFRDTDVILQAVERVEQRHPELIGGLGLYRATGPSGPFAHIDVRGSRARWTNVGSGRSVRASVRRPAAEPAERAQGVKGCSATGASAVLCQGSKD